MSEDTTFRSFNHEQGTNYAQNRRNYHPMLYQTIMDHHASTGGQFNTIVDVGCGPGTAVRSLASRFSHAFGLDPSEGMISTARSLGGVSSTSNPIHFEVSTAEDLGSHLSPPTSNSSVDLIVAATAAHWFDTSRFWPRAAQVLKPGGSVALWTSGYVCIDPSVPNYVAVQATIDELEERLKDYIVEGNRLTRRLYVDLPLPWTLATPVPEFVEASFLRKEWGTGHESESGNQFFVNRQSMDLDTLEKLWSTSGPVARWREANPDAVGTEHDVVRVTRREIERILTDAGVEKGKEILKGDVSGVLLMVKKKA